jgi:membrane associated rhomboid family serine protease
MWDITDKNITRIFFALGILIYSQFAFAYIGPGLGVGAVAAVLGTLLGLLMLVVGVVWYPIKKLIRHFWPKK